jgi:hypothetical protein
MANTRFTAPILFAGRPKAISLFGEMPMTFSPDYVEFWDDFTGIALDATNAWTVVKDSGASVAIADDVAGGAVLLSSAATTDDDGASIQGNEIFLPASGKTIWFETKLQSADADQTDVFAGLTVNFATNPEAALTAANRIGFQIDDGDASILCKTESGGTETSTDSGVDAADGADVKLGIRVNGTSKVEFYVDRALVATHTTNIPATELALAIMELSGDATGTKSVQVDYVMAKATR